MSAVDTSLFKPELVFFDFEAKDREDFFEKMNALLTEKGYVKDTWLNAIKTRENNYPTGLACEQVSVAIPHVDPEHIAKPYIAIVVPKKPITFQGMAGMPDVNAELIFNLGLLKHAEDQVAVLQALMNIFMNADAVAEIKAQTTQQGMVDTVTKWVAEV